MQLFAYNFWSLEFGLSAQLIQALFGYENYILNPSSILTDFPKWEFSGTNLNLIKIRNMHFCIIINTIPHIYVFLVLFSTFGEKSLPFSCKSAGNLWLIRILRACKFLHAQIHRYDQNILWHPAFWMSAFYHMTFKIGLMYKPCSYYPFCLNWTICPVQRCSTYLNLIVIAHKSLNSFIRITFIVQIVLPPHSYSIQLKFSLPSQI